MSEQFQEGKPSPRQSRDWPSQDLEAVPNCPVCGSSKRSPLYQDLEDLVFGVAPGRWDLAQCRHCDSAWLDPRPSPASLGRAYKKYFTHSASDQPIIRRIGILRTVLHDAINDYLNSRFGLHRKPSIAGGHWLIRLVPPLRAAADTKARHLPPLPDSGGRLLDIGFGNGGFLALAEEIGWDAEGIDFDASAVETARSRGLKVRHGNVTELHTDGAGFDVITLSHVVEHVQQPVLLLEQVFGLLKPGGTLWCETPNLNARGHRVFGRYWRGLEPPRHLVLFKTSTLFEIATAIGFVDLKQHWHGLSAFTVYGASEAICANGGTTPRGATDTSIFPALLAEIMQMLRPQQREFITLTARKPPL